MWVDEKLVNGLSSKEISLMYDGLLLFQRYCHSIANSKGWYVDPETNEPKERNFGEVVALMHSELSEALEADRKGLEFDKKLTDKDAVGIEFADCIIRIMDTAAARNINMADCLLSKCQYNIHREDHKLENRAKAGGKKY